MFSVEGLWTAMTGAGLGAVFFNFWNPHSTIPVIVHSIMCVQNGVTATTGNRGYGLCRSTARGTPGSTITPQVSTHNRRGIDPPSGVVLDLPSFSVLPTLDTEVLESAVSSISAPLRGGLFYSGEFRSGLYIPPGTGLAMRLLDSGGSVTLPETQITLNWRED